MGNGFVKFLACVLFAIPYKHKINVGIYSEAAMETLPQRIMNDAFWKDILRIILKVQTHRINQTIII